MTVDRPVDLWQTEQGTWHLRALQGLAEYEAAVRLQQITWGDGFSQRVPTSLLNVAQRIGGVASGAFTPEGELVGFVFGLTGIEGDRLVHWSDMLAVHPDVRRSGLGVALKHHQRRLVQELGVETMYWTTDPLEAGNANLNFNRLGARAVAYHVDFYGSSDSPLHGTLPTDRFLIRWDLSALQPASEMRGSAKPGSAMPGSAMSGDEGGAMAAAITSLPPLVEVAHEGAQLRPRVHAMSLAEIEGVGTEHAGVEHAGAVRVAIPRDMRIVREHDAALALAWRLALREALEPLMAAGAWVDAAAYDHDVTWLRLRGPAR